MLMSLKNNFHWVYIFEACLCVLLLMFAPNPNLLHGFIYIGLVMICCTVAIMFVLIEKPEA